MALDENAIGEINTEFQRVAGEMARVTNELQGGSKQALDEAKRLGDLQASTKAQVDTLLNNQGELQNRLEEITAAQRDMEQRQSSRRAGEAPQARTLGAQVVANADLKTFAAKGGIGSVRFDIENAITAIPSSGGALLTPVRDPNIVAVPQRRLTIKDLISTGEVTGPMVLYARQVATTGAAGIVPDDGTTAKPELGMSWESAEAQVRTIAGWMHVHKHMLDDLAFLRTEIDTELTYRIELAEEEQILAGDGTGDNLRGLITAAAAYNQTSREPGGVTALDRIRLGMLQVALARYNADGLVINEIDWTLAELLKDTLGRYIVGDPTQTITPRLWGRPVVATTAIPEDKFMVGAFKLAATYYERQGIQILASSEDRDNFIKNMVTVLAEKRGALAVKRPLALAYGDLGRIA